jgi:hypothetical protein
MQLNLCLTKRSENVYVFSMKRNIIKFLQIKVFLQFMIIDYHFDLILRNKFCKVELDNRTIWIFEYLL